MDEPLISQKLIRLRQELHHATAQYGSACLLGDKVNACRFLDDINQLLDFVDNLAHQIQKIESQEDQYRELLAEIAQEA